LELWPAIGAGALANGQWHSCQSSTAWQVIENVPVTDSEDFQQGQFGQALLKRPDLTVFDQAIHLELQQKLRWNKSIHLVRSFLEPAGHSPALYQPLLLVSE
jgi:hypothetical protein